MLPKSRVQTAFSFHVYRTREIIGKCWILRVLQLSVKLKQLIFQVKHSDCYLFVSASGLRRFVLTLCSGACCLLSVWGKPLRVCLRAPHTITEHWMTLNHKLHTQFKHHTVHSFTKHEHNTCFVVSRYPFRNAAGICNNGGIFSVVFPRLSSQTA